MSQIEQILDVARRYIGIKEQPPNSNNVIFNTRYYGKEVNGAYYAWCMAFQWCLFQDIDASELFYDNKKTASCGELMRWSKTKGLFVDKDYKPGDVLFFDFTGKKGAPSHTGIAESVGVTTIETIEGNTAVGNDSNGGEVMSRTRDIKYITGAYRPPYQEDDTMTGAEIFKALNEYTATLTVPDWAREEFNEAIAAKITDGSNPLGYIPRYQAAIMALRASKK